MRVSRRVWVGVAAVAVAAGVAVWWWGVRVRLPDVPAPALPASADPAAVADIARARERVLAAPRSAEAWGEYGMVLRAYARHPEADTAFRAAAALDPGDGRWPYLLGVHLAATDPAAAVEWLRKAADATVPEGAAEAVRMKLVETLLAADRPDEARAALGPEEPKTPRARLAAARIAAAAGDDRRAAELLSGLDTHPVVARQVLTLQSQVYQRQGRPAFAAQAAKRAATAPDAPWPDPLADAVPRLNQSRAGRLEEAARLLRDGRPLDAERVLRPLTVNSPDALPFVGRAEALAALGDRLGAVQSLEEGLRVAPHDLAANFTLGLLRFEDGEQLWQAGRKKEAEAAFRAAVERLDLALAANPDFGKALLLKGVALQRFLGRPDEGIALIRRFVELRPEVGEGHLRLGESLAAAGRTAEARNSLRKAVELAPPGDHRAAAALAVLDKASPGPR